MSRKQATRAIRPCIGIDLHTLEGLHQGSRTHCLELFSRVIRLVPEMDFVCLVDRERFHPDLVRAFTTPNARLAHMPHRNAIIRLLRQLPGLVKSEALDLLHTQYVIPLRLSAATAVTIHDILFEEYPQYFETAFRIRSQILFRYSARHSALVFTVSEYSKRELSQQYGIPSATITTLYNGADPVRFHPGAEGADQIDELGLTPGGYLLSVGRLEPRKNYLGLLEAFSMLPQPRLKLVIVGQPDFGFKVIFDRRDQLGLQNDVVFLQSVDDNQLGALYRHAKLFVYATFAEGFGMPVIEAMSSGVPVITSNTTSIPEIGGDAAVQIDPRQPVTIRDAIVELLLDPQKMGLMRKRGFERAETFNWDDSAAQLAARYRDHFA